MKKNILSFFAVFISLLFSGCKEFDQFLAEADKMRVENIGYWSGDTVAPALPSELPAGVGPLYPGMMCVLYESQPNQIGPGVNDSPLTAHVSKTAGFSLQYVAQNSEAAPYITTSMSLFVWWDGFLHIDQAGAYTFSLNNGENRCGNILVLLNGNKLFNFSSNHQQPELRRRAGSIWLNLSKGYYRMTIVGAYGSGYENGSRPDQHLTMTPRNNATSTVTLSPANFSHINEDAVADESLKPLLPEFTVQSN